MGPKMIACYFQGDTDLPVEKVNWYDCIEFCNRKSIKEGFRPVYVFDKVRKDPQNIYDTDLFQWLVEIDPTADGYRLQTEAQWEYAARGGSYCGFAADDIRCSSRWCDDADREGFFGFRVCRSIKDDVRG